MPGLKPTAEQDQAVALFHSKGSLKINAFAGTGKTTTLSMIAKSTPRRGIYLAFNKAIAEDAKRAFPDTVSCSTIHSLAFRATPSAYKHGDKMTRTVNANALAELLELKEWRLDRDHKLTPRSQGFLILQTLRRFMQSAALAPEGSHVPRYGRLMTAPEAVLAAVQKFTLDCAQYVWTRMQDAKDDMALGHDGYLKLWALSRPQIAAEFILLDEAQDTNPVVLDVLRAQPAQMVYVGDKYQQIYEWRGAINAMENIDCDHTSYLTGSFRFGDTIARVASAILARLGEKQRIVGNAAVRSRIGGAKPDAILARTNASAVTAIIEALDAGRRPHLVGRNKEEIMQMLRGVQDLKRGEPSIFPEFFGFANWNEVVEFARSGEGEHLLTFVNLVEARGERQLMWALGRTVVEDNSDLIISTAHQAKGREWKTVRLMDDFLKSKPTKIQGGNGLDEAEIRLFYVAFTRAREAIEVNPELLSMFGLDIPHMPPTRPQPAPHARPQPAPHQPRRHEPVTIHGPRPDYPSPQPSRPTRPWWQRWFS
jgi:AAA domain/UvrD-like helicase C-terminal domain